MSALMKIIEGIFKQANEKVDEILTEARQKAAEILKKGEADRAERERRIDETTERECREIAYRAQSADRQNRRRALLETRSQAINEVIAGAKEKLLNLPDKEYFDFLLSLFAKNAQPGDGIIRLAPADHAKIPDGFLERCRQVFPDYTLELGEDLDSICRGFVIEYGKIYQDCSIDSIFEAEEQAMRDRAYEVLSADV